MNLPSNWVYQIKVFDSEELSVCKVEVRDLQFAKEVKRRLFSAFPAYDGFSVECDLAQSDLDPFE